MKLPFFRKRSQQPIPEPDDAKAPDEESDVEHSSIDITIPRERIYQSFQGQPGPCPRCGGTLQQSYQSYVIVTRRGEKATDSFITGSDFGWFCTSCPTVVINPEDVGQMLETPLSHWDIGDQFTVLGIVNMDAVPPSKRNRPLGSDDNPIPLVEFTNVVDVTQPGHKQASPHRRRPKSKVRRR